MSGGSGSPGRVSGTAAPPYAPEDPSLPKPRRGLVDGTAGYLYYWNPETNVTQYERPLPPEEQLPPPPPLSPPPPRGRDRRERSRSHTRTPPRRDHRDRDRDHRRHDDYNSKSASSHHHPSPATTPAAAADDPTTEAYRRRHEITVIGDNVPAGPAPITAFESGGFPPEILKEVDNLDDNDLFDDMVQEMEQILLNSGEPHESGSFTDNHMSNAVHQTHHFRDGSTTASTSGTDDAYIYPLPHCPSKIDCVEVVGAKQRTGDVSFGDRMVGVKEYTVYLLKVRSGGDEWEIERRYREFYALYQQLKLFFSEKGLSLPPAWRNVEKESSKIFGNASPDVVNERSGLIQDCLHSLLVSNYPFGTPTPLFSFLSSGKPAYEYSFLKTLVPQSLQRLSSGLHSKDSDCNGALHGDSTSMGKKISLVVEDRPHKSTRQLLELQHYNCAGCHRHLDAGRTLLQELAQTIGWNKPRLCAYTSQLFCASCHTNDTAVLPARVLHHWDFSLYPISQLAKAYLESIYDQPMLCVSAVNPFLFSKVPALINIMSIRKKIAAMLPCVQCPFRNSIFRGLGVRRYFLDGNDFFALRDLVDLSKGAFAALPVRVQTISNRILVHITEQCLVCYDAGIPCAARQACDDPLALIFPFQEDEATKCGSCGSIFHKQCFRKISICPCGKTASTGRKIAALEQAIHDGANRPSTDLIQPPSLSSSSGFFSDILSKARPDKIWKPRNSTPVILMGSLPDTSM